MMRSRMSYFPNIRADFNTAQEVGEVINRSREYVLLRLNGKQDFTYREKVMIANSVGLPPEQARDYCRKE